MCDATISVLVCVFSQINAQPLNWLHHSISNLSFTPSQPHYFPTPKNYQKYPIELSKKQSSADSTQHWSAEIWQRKSNSLDNKKPTHFGYGIWYVRHHTWHLTRCHTQRTSWKIHPIIQDFQARGPHIFLLYTDKWYIHTCIHSVCNCPWIFIFKTGIIVPWYHHIFLLHG